MVNINNPFGRAKLFIICLIYSCNIINTIANNPFDQAKLFMESGESAMMQGYLNSQVYKDTLHPWSSYTANDLDLSSFSDPEKQRVQAFIDISNTFNPAILVISEDGLTGFTIDVGKKTMDRN